MQHHAGCKYLDQSTIKARREELQGRHRFIEMVKINLIDKVIAIQPEGHCRTRAINESLFNFVVPTGIIVNAP